MFSWNDNKPTVTTNPDNGSEDYSISQHQTRGSTSVNLLGGLPVPPDVPSDANTFIVGVDQVQLIHNILGIYEYILIVYHDHT